MAKILVTGVNGFVGKHLAHEIHTNGHEVLGLGHGGQPDQSLMDVLANYQLCDLTNKDEVSELDLRGVDAVISLAGLARVGNSFKKEELYRRINVEVFTNLADRLMTQNVAARIVAISTGAVYDPDQEMPLTEESKTVHDGSPYAISKLDMEKAVHKYRKQGLDCVTVRPFNHIGPGQEQGFLLPDLYSKIVNSDKVDHTIQVGSLETKRDYTDVRDIVRAYTSLALAPTHEHNLFNVCSGTSRSGINVLNTLLTVMGMLGKVEITVDQEALRRSDPPNLYGSYSRLKESVGWRPQIPFEQTIRDFVEWKQAA